MRETPWATRSAPRRSRREADGALRRRPPGRFANNIPGGARCVLERPPALAASCVLKSTANHSESAFATASPVSVGRAVSLQRWPPSPHPMRSLAPQPSTFARATKAPGSGSGSARSAGRPCSRPKKVTNSRLWLSPWAPSPTRAFRHRKIRSTTVADILGFDYRQGRRHTTRTPHRGEPCRQGTTANVPPDPSTPVRSNRRVPQVLLEPGQHSNCRLQGSSRSRCAGKRASPRRFRPCKLRRDPCIRIHALAVAD
jgi:hypothetical protein